VPAPFFTYSSRCLLSHLSLPPLSPTSLSYIPRDAFSPTSLSPRCSTTAGAATSSRGWRAAGACDGVWCSARPVPTTGRRGVAALPRAFLFVFSRGRLMTVVCRCVVWAVCGCGCGCGSGVA
jgi:hypothetical protein